MTVTAIHLGPRPAGKLLSVRSALAVAGKGLEGDRHFHPGGAQAGAALTLVEEEEVAAVGLAPGATRRQLTVHGVNLSTLVGRRFRVGAVQCYGVGLCEPCLHLQKLTRPGILRELVHRAGINADILTTGRIYVGDPVITTTQGDTHEHAHGKRPRLRARDPLSRTG